MLSSDHGSAILAIVKVAFDSLLLGLVDSPFAVGAFHLLYLLLKSLYSIGSGLKSGQLSHVFLSIFLRRRAQ
jgi:hypothetical protein